MNLSGYLIKLEMQPFYYPDRIVEIIYVKNNKNILKLRLLKFVLSLSASASALIPSTPILLFPKIMT